MPRWGATALKEFARAAVPPAPADCPECLGAGTVPCSVCAGIDSGESEFCSDGREGCETCSDGLKWMPCWLGAVRINRSVLWKWLNWIPETERATLWTLWEPPDPRKPRVFTGADWFLLIMPLRTEDGEALDDPRFPWPADAAGVPVEGVQP